MVRVLLIASLLATASLRAEAQADFSPRLQQRVQSLLSRDHYEEAGALLAPFAEFAHNNPALLFLIGRSELGLGEDSRATARFERARQLQPDDSEIHRWLGRSYASEARNGNPVLWLLLGGKILRCFERAVEVDPSNTAARMDLVKFYVVAPGLFGGGFDKARREAEQIARYDRTVAHFARGYIQYSLGQFGSAEKELKSAVALDPKNKDYYSWLGFLYLERQQYDKAFQTFETLLEVDPGDADAQYELGRTAAFSGSRLEQGEIALHTYLRRSPKPWSPSHAEAHLHLGVIYEKSGRKALAIREFAEAARARPELREASMALKRLSR